MTAPFVKAIEAAEIAPGGMKAVVVDGRELVICHCAGSFFAVDRRCGHMNAPLELGTLEGYLLTCPMHCAQFDVTTGEALSGPVPPDLGTDPPPPRVGAFLANVGRLMAHVRTGSIGSYRATAEAGWVWVELP